MEETHKSINTHYIVPTAEDLGGGYINIVATFGTFFQCFFFTQHRKQSFWEDRIKEEGGETGQGGA